MYLSRIFRNGDMLVISSNSIYYLVAEVVLDDNITNMTNITSDPQCLFTLYGGYRMWSQLSINCTIAGLSIMSDYSIDLYSNDISGSGGAVIKNTFYHFNYIQLVNNYGPVQRIVKVIMHMRIIQ